MIYHDANEVIGELFEKLLSRYKICLDTTMRGSDFIFDCVNLKYHKCLKINFKCSVSYTDSLDCLKNKKATINLKNDVDRCFQCVATIAPDCEEIGKRHSKNNKILSFYK